MNYFTELYERITQYNITMEDYYLLRRYAKDLFDLQAPTYHSFTVMLALSSLGYALVNVNKWRRQRKCLSARQKQRTNTRAVGLRRHTGRHDLRRYLLERAEQEQLELIELQKARTSAWIKDTRRMRHTFKTGPEPRNSRSESCQACLFCSILRSQQSRPCRNLV